MRVFGLNGEFQRAAKRAYAYIEIELTAKERDRLRALRLWRETGDVRLVSRTFGISRATLYRWRERFEPNDLSSVRDRSRRPHRLRRPSWAPSVKRAVRELRERYPRWGKKKLAVLVKAQGLAVSEPTVGRILSYLRARGELVEPRGRAISAKRRRLCRAYAIRKPKDYQARQPGDLVQLDTMDIRPVPGVILKQFTAHDVISRWNVLEAHQRATASLAASFLDTVEGRMPFTIRAAQVDGGSEFCADFEQECKRRGIRLFVLPPKSPKLNGGVERAHRTHTEEFYQVHELNWTVQELKPQLIEWERVYNTIRPHQALGGITPKEFLLQWGTLQSGGT